MTDPALTCDVVIVGAGLIGTAIGWRLATAGCSVTLVAGEPAAAASRVAAGMLAAVTEATFTEETLLRLNEASLARYGDFVDEVEQASGLPGGLSRAATVSVAYDADDLARLTALQQFLSRVGAPAERLFSRDLRRIEPLLSPRLAGGLLVPGDWSCDNRLLWAALSEAARRAGVRTVGGFVHTVLHTGEREDSTGRDAQRVSGVQLADGTRITAGTVVLANGAWAAQIAGAGTVPVRPVKGQILRLDPHGQPAPGVTIRALVQGDEVYLVPRPGGRELVVGATVEDKGFDAQVTAGGVHDLLHGARLVLPVTAEYGLAETSVGWRPGTPDNAPLLGPGSLRGLVLATGHHRNGVLLTPVTADVISAYVLQGSLPELARPFSPARFAAGSGPTPVPARTTVSAAAR